MAAFFFHSSSRAVTTESGFNEEALVFFSAQPLKLKEEGEGEEEGPFGGGGAGNGFIPPRIGARV